MADAPDHNRILREAARAALAPLGLTQKGRSRTWLDDRIWNLIVVEFQPSSWSRGTYLNVGVMWLWAAKAYISFDFGPYRVHELERADAEQWPERCHAVATLAATHVEELRATIADIRAADRRLSAHAAPGWPTFHAAVASALVQDLDRARGFIDRLLAEDAIYDWHRFMQAKAAGLRSSLGDPAASRAWIVGEIERGRAAQKLPPRSTAEIDASL